ncbi:hypothetical protein CVT26_014149 [Gymnopilus dilepis]|uniref:Arrestin-like N-terminal domain-containing protein n=1 Tax=Gymnopilus dilepis TaxID=231916 RepID=A0A409VUF3_9AGAR|nr:hypothetical protein CVT26_014149 [Gymnopilus dilepis]
MDRYSRLSTQSFASINTVLPAYILEDNSTPDNTSFDSEDASGSDSLSRSSSTAVLPRYSAILTTPPSSATAADDNATLVIADRRFEYLFPIRPNKPWCTLHLYSEDPQTASQRNLDVPLVKPKTPRFWGGQAIKGAINFDSESTQAVKKITVRLRGKIVTNSLEGGSQTFLEEETLLWQIDSDNAVGVVDGKFSKKHELPFSIDFPTHFSAMFALHSHSGGKASHHSAEGIRPFTLEASSHQPAQQSSKRAASTSQPEIALRTVQEGELVSTPPSFLENQITASIQYEFSVHIVHGRFRPNSKIKVNIAYTPSLVPGLSSTARRTAHEMRSLAPGPEYDPSGWISLPSIKFHGAVIGNLFEFNCELHLARPLSYVRGTSIPCYFTISSEDSKSLDILFTPNLPRIRLLRRIQYFEKVSLQTSNHEGLPQEFSSSLSEFPAMFPVLSLPTGKAGNLALGDLRSDIHEAGVGTWWIPPKNVLQEPNLRRMQGEIHLDADLQPSCASKFFSIEYFVEFLPFDGNFKQVGTTSGYAGISKNAIFGYPIEVATQRAPGEPIPVIFSKPPKRAIMTRLKE